MDLQAFKLLLGYGALFNFAVLLLWFFMIFFCRDWLYEFHSKIFGIDKNELPKIHFALMGQYKLGVYMFFAIPFLVIHFVLS